MSARRRFVSEKAIKMTIYLSSELIETLQQQTEQYVQKAISEWQNKSAAPFNSQPNPGSWSAAQCLEHLNIYGRYYLPAIENAIAKENKAQSKRSNIFRSGWLGNYFTNLMKPGENGSLKKKMKAPSNARPQTELNTPAVIAEFIDQQEKLLQLLEKAKSIDLNKARVPISIAKFIRLKLGDVFMFLIAHNQRHILQAERALNL
jgi:hypothetical protein